MLVVNEAGPVGFRALLGDSGRGVGEFEFDLAEVGVFIARDPDGDFAFFFVRVGESARGYEGFAFGDVLGEVFAGIEGAIAQVGGDASAENEDDESGEEKAAAFFLSCHGGLGRSDGLK